MQLTIPIELKIKEPPELTKAAIKDLEIKDNKQLFFSFFSENKIKESGKL